MRSKRKPKTFGGLSQVAQGVYEALQRGRVASALLLLLPGLVFAGPSGETVTAGQITVSRPDPGGTVISQVSDSAIIEWQSFSIGSEEYVRFSQPGSHSVVLNRVIGQNPSSILGRLSANGQVFLVNPRGIYFGPNARLDVGGLVASVLDISNEDFLAGNYDFIRGDDVPDGAAVVNEGVIVARERGYVVLAGDYAANRGVIEARLGTIALGAGEEMTLEVNDTGGLVSYAVDGEALTTLAGVENEGELLADGGRVIMTANVATDLVATAVNVEGLVQAQGIVESNGEVYLTAPGGGDIRVAGTIDTSAAAGTHRGGGTVSLRSQGNIELTPQSRVVSKGRGAGAGGSVVAVAERQLQFSHGANVDASGGTQGDGGFVELSGHTDVNLHGTVTAGRGGEVYVDPPTIILGEEDSPGVCFFDVCRQFVENVLQGGSQFTLEADDVVTIADLDAALDGRSSRGENGGDLIVQAISSAGGIVLMDDPTDQIILDGDFVARSGPLGVGLGVITLSNITANNILIGAGAVGDTAPSARTVTTGALTAKSNVVVLAADQITINESVMVTGTDATFRAQSNGNIVIQDVTVDAMGGDALVEFISGGAIDAGVIAIASLFNEARLSADAVGDVSFAGTTIDGPRLGVADIFVNGSGEIHLDDVTVTSMERAEIFLSADLEVSARNLSAMAVYRDGDGGPLTVQARLQVNGDQDVTINDAFVYANADATTRRASATARSDVNISTGGNINIGSTSSIATAMGFGFADAMAEIRMVSFNGSQIDTGNSVARATATVQEFGQIPMADASAGAYIDFDIDGPNARILTDDTTAEANARVSGPASVGDIHANSGVFIGQITGGEGELFTSTPAVTLQGNTQALSRVDPGGNADVSVASSAVVSVRAARADNGTSIRSDGTLRADGHDALIELFNDGTDGEIVVNDVFVNQDQDVGLFGFAEIFITAGVNGGIKVLDGATVGDEAVGGAFVELSGNDIIIDGTVRVFESASGFSFPRVDVLLEGTGGLTGNGRLVSAIEVVIQGNNANDVDIATAAPFISLFGLGDVVIDNSAFGDFTEVFALGEFENVSIEVAGDGSLNAFSEELLALGPSESPTSYRSLALTAGGSWNLESAVLEVENDTLIRASQDVNLNNALIHTGSLLVQAGNDVGLMSATIEATLPAGIEIHSQGAVNLTDAIFRADNLLVDGAALLDVTGAEFVVADVAAFATDGDFVGTGTTISAAMAEVDVGGDVILQDVTVDANAIDLTVAGDLSLLDLMATQVQLNTENLSLHVGGLFEATGFAFAGESFEAEAGGNILMAGTRIDVTNDLHLETAGEAILFDAMLTGGRVLIRSVLATDLSGAAVEATTANGIAVESASNINAENATLMSVGDIDARAVDDIELGGTTASAGGRLMVNSEGNIVASAPGFESMGDLRFAAVGELNFEDATVSAGNHFLTSTAGVVTIDWSNLQSEGDVIIFGASGVDLLDTLVAAGNRLSIVSDGSVSVSAATLQSVGNTELSAMGGDAQLADGTVVAAGNHLSISSQGGIAGQAADLQSGLDTALSAGLDVNIDNAFLMAGRRLRINSGGTVTAPTATLRSDGNTELSATGGDVQLVDGAVVVAGNHLSISSQRGIAGQAADLQSGLDTVLSAGLDVNVDNALLMAGRRLGIDAGGRVMASAATLQSVGNTELSAMGGDVQLADGTTVVAGNHLSISSQRGIAGQAADLQSGLDTVLSAGLDVNVDNALLMAGRRLGIDSGGRVMASAATLQSVGNTELSAMGGDVQLADGTVLVAGRHLSISSQGGVAGQAVNLQSGGNAVLFAGGDVNVDNAMLTAGRRLLINSGGTATAPAATLRSGGSTQISAGGDVQLVDGTVVVAGRHLLISSQGEIAGQAVNFQSGWDTGLSAGGDVNADSAMLVAGRRLRLVSGGNVTVPAATLRSIGKTEITAAGGDAFSEDGTVVVVSDDLPIPLQGRIAGQAVNLQSGSDTTLSAGGDVSIGNGTLTVGRRLRINSGGTLTAVRAELESTNNTRLVVGGDVGLDGGTVTAGNRLGIASQGAIVAPGANLRSDADTRLSAVDDINLTDVTLTAGILTAIAGGDVIISGATLAAQTILMSGENILNGPTSIAVGGGRSTANGDERLFEVLSTLDVEFGEQTPSLALLSRNLLDLSQTTLDLNNDASYLFFQGEEILLGAVDNAPGQMVVQFGGTDVTSIDGFDVFPNTNDVSLVFGFVEEPLGELSSTESDFRVGFGSPFSGGSRNLVFITSGDLLSPNGSGVQGLEGTTDGLVIFIDPLGGFEVAGDDEPADAEREQVTAAEILAVQALLSQSESDDLVLSCN